MKTVQPNGKWWLAAVLLPVLAIVGGIFFAYGAPHNQSDWFGGAFFARLFLGLLIGCVLSIVATAVSVAKREKLCAIALRNCFDSGNPVIDICCQGLC
jgi:ABC-type transport system involved in multi-copper enzyme maturation permease subunit